MSGSSSISNNNRIANILTDSASDSSCPSAVSANTFRSNITYLLGPMPAAGAVVSNLEAVKTGTTASAANTATIDVMNNTTGLVVLSCTINNVSLSTLACQNQGSGTVAAGQYLQVRMSFSGSGMNGNDDIYSVSFRY